MHNDNYKRNQNSSHTSRGGNKLHGKRSNPRVIPPRSFGRESDVGKPSETGCAIPSNRIMGNKDSSEVSTLREACTPGATSSPRASSQAASSEPEDRMGLRSHSQSEDDRLRGSSDE